MTGNVTFDFTDHVVLLTGAAGGIASALARQYAEAGAQLVLTDLNLDGAQRVADGITARGLKQPLAIALNAADAESIDAMVTVVREAFGRVDVVVPAAGIYPSSPITEMADDAWRTVMSINLDGVFMLLKRVIPLMPPGSAIVNVGSVAGHRGSHSHGHYAASKAGIISLTRTLALELAPDIRVNVVSPGIVMTPMVDDLLAVKGDQLIAATPLQRNAEADEIASVILFLSSSAASYIHGEVVHVNGGLFMAG